MAGVGRDLPRDAIVSTELEIKYEGYFAREREQADRVKRMGECALPSATFPTPRLRSLTIEARQKLVRDPAGDAGAGVAHSQG